MSENEEMKKTEEVEEYKTVEQLEDVDFEKENEEKKKKSKVKNIIILVVGLLVLAALVFVAYHYISRGTPETVIEDFVSSYNAGEFDKCLETIDLKGFYALTTTSEGEEIDENTNLEKFYTKFDARYKEAENDDECKEFVETMSKIDLENAKETLSIMKFTITEMKEPVLIQNTKSLYKITTNVDVEIEGQTESDQLDFYVTRIDNEYKIVGGELTETVLYMMLMSEYYSEMLTTAQ